MISCFASSNNIQARSAAPGSIGGTTTVWIATVLQTSNIQLLKWYWLTLSHSVVVYCIFHFTVSFTTSVFRHQLYYQIHPLSSVATATAPWTDRRHDFDVRHQRAHVASTHQIRYWWAVLRFRVSARKCCPASDLYCAGGYVLARALVRLVAEPPVDVLPEFLYKGLCVSAERLAVIKADEFWDKCLQLHFQSPVFMTGSSSLSRAVQVPGICSLLSSVFCFFPPISTSLLFGLHRFIISFCDSIYLGVNVLLIVDTTTSSRSASAKVASGRKVARVHVVALRNFLTFRVDFTTESRLPIEDFLTTMTSAPLCLQRIYGEKRFKALHSAVQVYVCSLVDVRVSFEM